jgi:hypothetical protein
MESEMNENGGSQLFESCWTDVEANRNKRSRINTGGHSEHSEHKTICQSEYNKLSIDDKLSVMFTQMNTIGHKVEDCLNIYRQVHNIETKMSEHEFRIKLLEYKSIDLEARSRRNNLIFGGIPENKDENCFQVISDFLQTNLQIEPCPPMPRAHRLGRFKPGSTRPIIVYFLDTRDTEFVLSRANMLRGTNFNINRDFPKEIVDARKSLWPEYKRLRAAYKESKISIVYPAKLVKDGRVMHDAFPQWNLVMQGNRIPISKPVFTNIPTDQPAPSSQLSRGNVPSSDHSRDTSVNQVNNSGDSRAQTAPSQNTDTQSYSSVVQERSKDSTASRSSSIPPHVPRREQSSSPIKSRGQRNHAPNSPRKPLPNRAPPSRSGTINHRPWATQKSSVSASSNDSQH